MLQFRKRTKLYILYIYMFFFSQAFVQKKLRKIIYMSTLHFTKKNTTKILKITKTKTKAPKLCLNPTQNETHIYSKFLLL